MRNAHSKIKKITPAIDTEQPQRVPFSQFVALSGWFTVSSLLIYAFTTGTLAIRWQIVCILLLMRVVALNMAYNGKCYFARATPRLYSIRYERERTEIEKRQLWQRGKRPREPLVNTIPLALYIFSAALCANAS